MKRERPECPPAAEPTTATVGMTLRPQRRHGHLPVQNHRKGAEARHGQDHESEFKPWVSGLPTYAVSIALDYV